MLFTMLLFMAIPLPAHAQDEAATEPTIIKDSVQVETFEYEWGPANRHGDLPAWTPEIEFRVNEPIPKGSRIWVEFSYPGKKDWLWCDCSVEKKFPGSSSWSCPGDYNFPQEKSVRFLGTVDFAIHLTNELLGTNLVLFRGKAKVGKTPLVNKNNPTFFDYYVDEDWRVPIGYLRRERNDRTLNIEMWFRGRHGRVRPLLFHGGKEVAEGINCPSIGLYDPAGYHWSHFKCELFAGSDEIIELNPGEYEIKVLQNDRLTRTANFTVAPDGSYDNGIAAANKLGSAKVIIGFKMLGEQGPLDKLAWKTGAYYGNPLTGFTAPP